MSIQTTYFSALTHEKVKVTGDARLFSLVRQPADWITDVVDRNISALAPPDELLEAYKKVENAARDAGEDEPQAVAWRSVQFEERFREQLSKPGPRQVLKTLVEDARAAPVWLVCYEADDSYCHRRLVAEEARYLAREELPTRPHLNDACSTGYHTLIADGKGRHTKSCLWCGLSAQTIYDYLGHHGGEKA
ncbi:DUF488 domain-containing protein [Haloferax larsenii]|uniref:DUF488 domain-containing protein n=1 Tax=Haloferax larsenii TaxID=302484 RepID=A0ABY5RGH2_HALLR|nr:DUF488 domain-containing protein [Haloferax larsenii]UVE51441.1 DUF488 domain-containing protein [Haloferax larsenii]